MKKLLSVLFCIVAIFALAACGEAAEEKPSSDASLTVTQVNGINVDGLTLTLTEAQYIAIKEADDLKAICTYTLAEKATLTVVLNENENKLVFTATAEDGETEKIVTVAITVLSSDTSITVTKINGVDVESGKVTLSAAQFRQMTGNVPVESFCMYEAAEGATVAISWTAEKDGIIFAVIAADGVTSNTVTVEVDVISDDASITVRTVAGVAVTDNAAELSAAAYRELCEAEDVLSACTYDVAGDATVTAIFDKQAKTITFHVTAEDGETTNTVTVQLSYLSDGVSVALHAIGETPVSGNVAHIEKSVFDALKAKTDDVLLQELEYTLDTNATVTAAAIDAATQRLDLTVTAENGDVAVTSYYIATEYKLEDNDASIQYTNYGDALSVAYKSGGTCHSVAAAGASFEFTVADCTQVVLFGERSSVAGAATLTVDGQPFARHNLCLGSLPEATKVNMARCFDTGTLSRGSHTVKLETENTGWVEFDYALVICDPTAGPTETLEDTDERITYTGDAANGYGLLRRQVDKSGGTFRSSATPGESFEFTATDCTQVKLFGYRAGGGVTVRAKVFIDGVLQAPVYQDWNNTETYFGTDFHNVDVYQLQWYDTGILPRGDHQIRVEVGSGWVELDYVQIVRSEHADRQLPAEKHDTLEQDFTYSDAAWTELTTRDDRYNYTLKSTAAAGATITYVAKNCTQIKVYAFVADKADLSADYEIYVDGVKTDINTMREGTLHECGGVLIFDSGNLLYGDHVLEFKAVRGWMDIDYVETFSHAAVRQGN